MRGGRVLAVIALLWLAAGCGAPESCSWAGSPEGAVRSDVVGKYTGTSHEGKPITVVLAADGRYTNVNLTVPDFITPKWLPADPAGTWTWSHLGHWYDRVSGDPPEAWVELSGHVKVKLNIGGTRAAPVLYDVGEYAETCDTLGTLLRHG